MTRNMIFGSAIAVILALMVVGSFISGDEGRDDDDYGFKVNVDVQVDGDEIVITSERGKTVVYSSAGRQECASGQDAIIITRSNGSQTRIDC